MKPQVDHILSFVKVAELGSFSKAAERLNVSKSVVSKHITALESALKTQLLQRSTRSLKLTEAGLHYFQQVKHLPDQLRVAQNSLQALTQKPCGRLKIIAPENLCQSLKQVVVPHFLKRYPDVTLDIQFVRPASDYVSHDFDLIILWKIASQQFPDYALVPKKLFSISACLFATTTYLKKHGTPKTLNDLKNHNCISSAGTQWPFCKQGAHKMHYIQVSGNILTQSEEMVHAITTKDLAIAYAYPVLFKDEIRSGKIKQIMPEETHVNIDVCAFHHPTPYLPLKTRLFLDEMKQYYDAVSEEVERLSR
jgi:DNA-binding transcriptional LysR family regulator